MEFSELIQKFAEKFGLETPEIVDDDFKSTRLVGRSVWNDKWILVIPASALNQNREKALEKFINGIGDIKIGIKAYSRQGN